MSSWKSELAYERRGLVEIAVTNPGRAYNKVDDAGPAHARFAVGPNLEINCLVSLQIG